MDFPPKPVSEKELKRRLKKILDTGTFTIPAEGFGGTGGAGDFLQALLGVPKNNKDLADSYGWEVKLISEQTALLTLFHLDPYPRADPSIMREYVTKFGEIDAEGRRALRHTVSGKSDKFHVVACANQICVRPIGWAQGDDQACWPRNQIMNKVASKLSKLMLVTSEKHGQEITFKKATYFETIDIDMFIQNVKSGIVKIDFDARDKAVGSKTLRNHGTKFRIKPEDIPALYDHKNPVK